MPMIVYDILVDLELYQGNSYIAVPVYCLYWSQYSLNFFIYAARSDQYRKAYLYFLQTVKYQFVEDRRSFLQRTAFDVEQDMRNLRFPSRKPVS